MAAFISCARSTELERVGKTREIWGAWRVSESDHRASTTVIGRSVALFAVVFMVEAKRSSRTEKANTEDTVDSFVGIVLWQQNEQVVFLWTVSPCSGFARSLWGKIVVLLLVILVGEVWKKNEDNPIVDDKKERLWVLVRQHFIYGGSRQQVDGVDIDKQVPYHGQKQCHPVYQPHKNHKGTVTTPVGQWTRGRPKGGQTLWHWMNRNTPPNHRNRQTLVKFCHF